MQPLYFDHGATTPVRREVREVMLRAMEEDPANPGSLHDPGQRARDWTERARREVAKALSASPREILFTGSGTESNNLALLGAARRQREKGRHVITSRVEHPSVLDTCRQLEREGFRITCLPVDEFGRVRTGDLKEALTEETVLVSIMAANNEVGTLMPIREMAALTRKKGALFHTDAVQLFGKAPLNVRDLGIDLLSVGGHKVGGPKGVGVLYLRKGVRIQPVFFGGGQERGLRPGTLNVPGIAGMGMAARLASAEASHFRKHISRLRDLLWQRIAEEIGNVRLNGHPTDRLPNNLNIGFDRLEGQAVLLELNRRNVAVSSGSACSAGKQKASHVLTSMGQSAEEAFQSLRITLGRETTEAEIHDLVERMKESVSELRARLPVL
ncbi:cysteine desulfurase [Melghirimyces profundicolus]|uniref:cysteine desulfurase n=1 Tax=Melghirimyces profundicolus TaxID=1242148 RepID=A0A2T6BC86_9BACL|nr:cysteine desulfurase family protein [Melghirimyces profundicolus]PTX53688.1 cysteine desulfurase [Melghirimyces profundicolus]